jgi:hypothetical protein
MEEKAGCPRKEMAPKTMVDHQPLTDLVSGQDVIHEPGIQFPVQFGMSFAIFLELIDIHVVVIPRMVTAEVSHRHEFVAEQSCEMPADRCFSGAGIATQDDEFVDVHGLGYLMLEKS